MGCWVQNRWRPKRFGLTHGVIAMNAFNILAVFCLIGAMASLTWGVISMARGGEYDLRHSDQLMFARVKWHALAVALLVAGYFLIV